MKGMAIGITGAVPLCMVIISCHWYACSICTHEDAVTTRVAHQQRSITCFNVQARLEVAHDCRDWRSRDQQLEFQSPKTQPLCRRCRARHEEACASLPYRISALQPSAPDSRCSWEVGNAGDILNQVAETTRVVLSRDLETVANDVANGGIDSSAAKIPNPAACASIGGQQCQQLREQQPSLQYQSLGVIRPRRSETSHLLLHHGLLCLHS